MSAEAVGNRRDGCRQPRVLGSPLGSIRTQGRHLAGNTRSVATASSGTVTATEQQVTAKFPHRQPNWQPNWQPPRQPPGRTLRLMLERRNLFSALEDEWMRVGRSAAARAALARWAEATPALAYLGDLLTLVHRCHERDPAAPEFVAAVLREAEGDRWAQRTVLQVILPGLRAVARRASRRYRGRPEVPWETRDELDQVVVEIALERIRALARTEPDFPCRTIVDGTWQRIRHRARTGMKEADRWVELALAEQKVVASTRSRLEDLAALVTAAVEQRVLDPFDAGLVYSCYVTGYRIEELAQMTGRSERTLWRRRRNAETVLAMFVTDGPTGYEVRRPSPALGAGPGPLSLRRGPEAGVKGALRRPPAALDPGRRASGAA